MIAHRLSTVRRADRILVLGNGRVLEEGTHEELLLRPSAYRRLYESQFAVYGQVQTRLLPASTRRPRAGDVVESR